MKKYFGQEQIITIDIPENLIEYNKKFEPKLKINPIFAHTNLCPDCKYLTSGRCYKHQNL